MADKTQARRVFVYGTLKSTEGNHHLLNEATLLGDAETEARYTMIDLGYYPGVLLHGGNKIIGEVYEITPSIERSLDALEGVDCGLYGKTTINTRFGPALMYHYLRANLAGVDNYKVISEGVWR